MRSAPFALLGLIALWSCSAPPPPADEPPVPGARDDAVAITPYLWAAAIAGEAEDEETEVEGDFPSALDFLEAGLMLAVDARLSDEVHVLGDVAWVQFGQEGTRPISGASVDGTFDVVHAQLSGAWRPPGQELVIFDVLAGLRVVDFATRLQWGSIDNEQTVTLYDPVIGLRATVPFGHEFQLTLHGDVGGFGVGTDLSYQLAAIFGYSLSEDVALVLGYRQIGLEFSEPELSMDMAFGGALVGLRIEF